MENSNSLGHFQRIADSMAEGLIHRGDSSDGMQPGQLPNSNHCFRQLLRLLHRLHKRARANLYIK